jgi:hypothetical protein
MVSTPVMCRDSTATWSSANCTRMLRLTYSLGLSGNGQRSLILNMRPMSFWSRGSTPSSQKPSHQCGSCPVPVRQALSIEPM